MALSGVVVHRVEGHVCIDHAREAHDVPPDFKSTSLDLFFPWTVWRQIWANGLRPCHSGVSTYVLLFSEIHLSLVHHYRVFRRGLPNFAFRRDYLDQLWVFVSPASALLQRTLSSPAPGSSGLTGDAHPMKHEARVWDAPVCEKSAITVVQDVRELAGNIVYDCRPPLLPVSIPLHNFRRSSVDGPAAPSNLAATPEETPGFSGSVQERVATPGFAEAPLDDTGTDLEDELEYVSLLPTMISPLPD